MRPRFKVLIYYFLQGVLLTAPIAVTLYVLYLLFEKIDGIIPVGLGIPGLGLLSLFALLTLIGYIGSLFIFIPLMRWVESILDRAPLIKTIYTSVKDLVSAFVGKQKRFNQPVLVKLSQDSTFHRLGFITREDLSSLGIRDNKVAVYMPHSYAWSGNTIIIDRQYITPVSGSASEVMKFVVSGGVSSSEDA